LFATLLTWAMLGEEIAPAEFIRTSLLAGQPLTDGG
jgi:hypothetical protein